MPRRPRARATRVVRCCCCSVLPLPDPKCPPTRTRFVAVVDSSSLASFHVTAKPSRGAKHVVGFLQRGARRRPRPRPRLSYPLPRCDPALIGWQLLSLLLSLRGMGGARTARARLARCSCWPTVGPGSSGGKKQWALGSHLCEAAVARSGLSPSRVMAKRERQGGAERDVCTVVGWRAS
jgi:hypothetical protein